MATVTDLTGNLTTITDDTSVQFGEDSNVNVFEFGNLILADILPSVKWFVNKIGDLAGNSLVMTDSSGNSLVVSDTSGSSATVVDISGS